MSLPAITPAVAAAGARWPGPLIVSLLCVFAAMAVLAGVAVGALYPDRAQRMARNIQRYGPRGRPVVTGGPVRRIAERWVSPLLRIGGMEQRLAERLDLAGIGREPAEWALLGGCVSVGIALVAILVSGNPVVGVLVGALVGWLGMRLILNLRISRRRAAFSDQLPDVLQFITSSLHSGFSLAQGLDAVVREDTQPAAGEFSRALAQTRIGMVLEDALDTVADRMDSPDLRWTVIAVRIQREVGGNLAEVLGHTVETMRERASIRRHVRSLSAEGRLSAYILVALPILVGGWLFLASKSYVRPLYTTGPGIGMLVFAVLMVAVGSLWMRKMVKVEV
jgi:Flp pilus assembly protein TadB